MKDNSKIYYQKNLDYYDFFEHAIYHQEYDKLSDIVIKLIKKNKKNSILDVGCGTGKLIKDVLDKINDINIYIDYIDPNSYAVNKYVDNIPRKYLKKGLVIDWQDFIKENKKKYDLIIANNSLYTGDLEETNLLKFVEFLHQDGHSMITLEKEDSDFVKIQKKLWKKIHNVEYNKNTFEMLIDKIKKYNISYEQETIELNIPKNIITNEDLLKLFTLIFYTNKKKIKSYFKEISDYFREKSYFFVEYGCTIIKPKSF